MIIARVPGLLRVLLLGLLLALAACTAQATPTPTPPPPTPTFTPTPVGTAYPLKVTDLLGRTVDVPKRPSRIVSVSPTATEVLYRIGGVAVGRDTSSKYPAEAQGLPTVGGAYTPSVEAIAALQPDLILIEALTQARFADTFKSIGVPVVTVRATSLDDVAQSLTLLGKVIDRSADAARAVADIQARVNAAKAQGAGGKKALVLISDANRNIYAAKAESYPGTIAAMFQLVNPAAAMPDSGPYPGFTQFSAEQALAANPDVIFTISPAPPPAPTLSASLPRIPGYADLSAVKAGRVRELDPNLFLQAPGPRIAEAAEALALLLKETTG